jgi:hypothetical protein
VPQSSFRSLPHGREKAAAEQLAFDTFSTTRNYEPDTYTSHFLLLCFGSEGKKCKNEFAKSRREKKMFCDCWRPVLVMAKLISGVLGIGWNSKAGGEA